VPALLRQQWPDAVASAAAPLGSTLDVADASEPSGIGATALRPQANLGTTA
jgi:hypothetical protein